MIDPAQFDRVRDAVPLLHAAPQALVRDLQYTASLSTLSKGHDIFIEGDQVDSIALITAGSVRVYKIGETGREITLYRFGVGEACILTTNAILSRQTFPATATVERDVQAIMIPADALRTWIVQYEAWRTFIFGLLANRLSTVMTVVNEVAFRRMDARIAALILTRLPIDSVVRITHQQIATELGSTREVISRILEELADQRIIVLERGAIQVIDIRALRDLIE